MKVESLKCLCGNDDFVKLDNGYFVCTGCNSVYKDDFSLCIQTKRCKEISQPKPTVTCPYCQSTNTQKISGLSKAGSVALWGIFALGKTTKQWHCNNCKSDF